MQSNLIMDSRYHKTATDLKAEEQEVLLVQENPAQFEVLYERYYEDILLFIYQRVDSKEDAFDLCSQVFMIALSKIQQFKFKGVPFSAWLYRIALNEMNKAFRKQTTQRTINLDDKIAGILMSETEQTDDRYESVPQAIQQLKPDQLEMIELRFFEERSFKEIADMLQLTENNAKVKTYRALDKLKELIKIPTQ